MATFTTLPARPYKVYSALLNQSGTNAPVATVLENTLGGTVVWSYDDVGFYSATLSGAFPLAKTFFTAQSGGSGVSLIMYSNEAGEPSNSITLETNLNGTPTNGQMYYASVEIRVYP